MIVNFVSVMLCQKMKEIYMVAMCRSNISKRILGRRLIFRQRCGSFLRPIGPAGMKDAVGYSTWLPSCRWIWRHELGVRRLFVCFPIQERDCCRPGLA